MGAQVSHKMPYRMGLPRMWFPTSLTCSITWTLGRSHQLQPLPNLLPPLPPMPCPYRMGYVGKMANAMPKDFRKSKGGHALFGAIYNMGHCA